jgi:hypothetical protein
MCNPMAVMLIGTAVQAAGSLKQGADAKEAADTRAQELGYQAEQNRADAQVEREAAEVRADKVRKAGGLQKSQARSALAKSGVVADAGSALTIQEYIDASSEEDALTEIITGKHRAKKIEIGAATLDREAMYERKAGTNAMQSGILGAGKSLLGAYTSAAKPGWKTQS